MEPATKNVIMQTVSSDGYHIYITPAFSQQENFTEAIKNYSSVFVLVDTNTKKYCYPAVQKLLPKHDLLEIPDGEKEKNIDTCKHLWNRLVELQADRKSLLINLGGGVIGDMGGFVASTFKRGFHFLNIPTTLLAQVDASVGGKLGIDLSEMKNLIGVFNNPQSIFICTDFLHTLPHEQLLSGFAEVLKHGLIADKEYWDFVKQIDVCNFSEWKQVVARSVEIKNSVVMEDMYETGLRKILNFGHTIGHAIETLSLRHDTKPLLHGEAIAIGMICEAWLSYRVNHLPENNFTDIVTTFSKFYKKYDTSVLDFTQCMQLITQDKKNTKGTLSFSLLKQTGTCEFDISIDAELIKESLHFYQTLA